MINNMRWRGPQTAPKDGNPFLADIGMVKAVLAVWNGASEKFCVAELTVDQYEGIYQDTYFQNEYVPTIEIKGWMPLPFGAPVKRT